MDKMSLAQLQETAKLVSNQILNVEKQLAAFEQCMYKSERSERLSKHYSKLTAWLKYVNEEINLLQKFKKAA